MYGSFKLRRVYYSAFSPIPNSPKSVPLAAPPLMREHRLYQADFQAFVAVERGIAKQALQRLNDGKIKGRSLRVRIL